MNSILSFNVWLLWLFIYMYNLMNTIIESVLKLGLFRVCVGFSSGNVWEEKTLSNVWKPFSPLCGLKCWSSCLRGCSVTWVTCIWHFFTVFKRGVCCWGQMRWCMRRQQSGFLFCIFVVRLQKFLLFGYRNLCSLATEKVVVWL